MAEFNILETLELVGKAKTREEKRQVLTDRDNFATRALLQLNYHPDVKWHLPSGAPPYTPGQVADSTPNSLHFEVKKLDYYVDPSPHDLPMLRRESMFVELLERVDPKMQNLLLLLRIENCLIRDYPINWSRIPGQIFFQILKKRKNHQPNHRPRRTRL